jgi:hypothetical protein
MTLPIDFVGVQWFLPTPVWELEDHATPMPATGSADNGASAACVQADGTSSPVQTWVFAGYANQTHFGWLPATTPISRPWEFNEIEDTEHKHRPKPPVLVADVPDAAASLPDSDDA